MALLDWLSMAPRPAVLCSDRGSHFLNATVSELGRLVHWTHHVHLAYCHRSNGTVETAHRQLLRLVRCLLSELNADLHVWPYLIGVVGHVMNSTPSLRNEGLTPFEVVYGLPTPPPVSVALCDRLGGLVDIQAVLSLEGVKKAVAAARTAWDFAGSQLPESNSHHLLTQLREQVGETKKGKAFKNRAWSFSKGDWVMVSRFESDRPKLSHVWTGPFRVTEVTAPRRCRVETPDGSKSHEVHLERMRFVSAEQIGEPHDVDTLQRFHDLHGVHQVADVSAVIDHKVRSPGHDPELLIEYAGFPGEAAWLPLSSVFAYEFLEAYVENPKRPLSASHRTAIANHAAAMRRADADAGAGQSVAPTRWLVESHASATSSNKKPRRHRRR